MAELWPEPVVSAQDRWQCRSWTLEASNGVDAVAPWLGAAERVEISTAGLAVANRYSPGGLQVVAAPLPCSAMRPLLLSCVAIGLAFGGGLLAQRSPADVEWRYYSGDNGSTKYSPLDQINKENVAPEDRVAPAAG